MERMNANPQSWLEQKKSFRDLAGLLVQDSNLFPVVITDTGSMSVTDAVEQDKTADYLDLSGKQFPNPVERDDARDISFIMKRYNRVHDLTLLHDELQKEHPDQSAINKILQSL